MRNVAKQGKIVNLIAFLLGEVGRGPDRGRMRGSPPLATREQAAIACFALISPLRGQLPPRGKPTLVGADACIRPRGVEDAALYKNCHPFIEVRIL